MTSPCPATTSTHVCAPVSVCVWLCVCGCACVAAHVWLCVCGCVCVAVCVSVCGWLPVAGCVRDCVHVMSVCARRVCVCTNTLQSVQRCAARLYTAAAPLRLLTGPSHPPTSPLLVVLAAPTGPRIRRARLQRHWSQRHPKSTPSHREPMCPRHITVDSSGRLRRGSITSITCMAACRGTPSHAHPTPLPFSLLPC